MRDLLQNVSQIQTKGRLVGGACVRGAKNRDIINFYEICNFLANFQKLTPSFSSPLLLRHDLKKAGRFYLVQ